MKISCLLLILTLLSACGSATLPVYNNPNDFYQYEDAKNIKSISADGIIYRVKHVELKQGDISFWRTALKTHMVEDGGYLFVKEQNFYRHNKNAYYIELNAPVGQEDFTYLIAIYEADAGLIVVEAAGEIMTFEKHRENILDAIISGEKVQGSLH